jgi:DoxX-like family
MEITMGIATIVISALLAVAFAGSGGLKVAGAKQSLQIRDQLRIRPRLWTLIGALEVAGAMGLLVGLAVPAIGVAAAVGLGLLMAGAIGAHVRANDSRSAAPAALLLVLSVAAAIVHIMSM